MAKNRTSCYLSSLSTWYGNNCNSQRTLTQKKEKSQWHALPFILPNHKRKRKRKKKEKIHELCMRLVGIRKCLCVSSHLISIPASVVEGGEDQLKHFGSENKKAKKSSFWKRKIRNSADDDDDHVNEKETPSPFSFFFSAAITTIFSFSSCKSMSLLWPLMLSHGLTVQRLYSKASFLCISWLYTHTQRHTLEKRETTVFFPLRTYLYFISLALLYIRIGARTTDTAAAAAQSQTCWAGWLACVCVCVCGFDVGK